MRYVSITHCVVRLVNCHINIDFFLPSALWAKRVTKFEVSFGCSLSVL